MTEQKKGRKGGRKANLWSLLTFADIAAYLAKEYVSQTDFAKAVGVTSSTFHNWKVNRCAPDEETQGKISALITGKEIAVKTLKNKKITKVTARGSRGAGSSTLAALGEGSPEAAVKKPRKNAKKVAVQVAESEAPKATPFKDAKKIRKLRIGRVVSTPPAASNGAIDGWNDLKSLAQFLKANDGRSPDDVKSVVEKLAAARQVASLFS